MSDGLKLQARDSEDVAVISAILQDAIVTMGDLAYDAAARQFMLAASRFRWEATRQLEPACERVNCVITVTGVSEVQFRKLDPAAHGVMHELLALLLEGQELRLVFAGDAQLRLKLADWQLRLEDFGAPWPVSQCPAHETQGAA